MVHMIMEKIMRKLKIIQTVLIDLRFIYLVYYFSGDQAIRLFSKLIAWQTNRPNHLTAQSTTYL